MNIEEIRKNKPDGATHYLIRNGGVQYYKNDNGYYVYENGWFRLSFIGNQQARVQLAYLAMMIKPL